MNLPAPEVLFYAMLLGVGLGAVFTLLEVLRIVLTLRKVVTFLLDVLFCVFASAMSFLLALAVSGGPLRLYQILCEALGFGCVYLTVTYAARGILQRLIRMIGKISERTRKYREAISGKKLQKRREKLGNGRKKRRFFKILSKKIEKNT